MGNPLTLSPQDPRTGNVAREQLIHILQSLVPPPNFKVTLSVDRATEKLQLKVLKRKVQETYAFGGKLLIWWKRQDWDNVECEQRRLEGRTYEDLMGLLRSNPEFLEFDLEVAGATQPKLAHIF